MAEVCLADLLSRVSLSFLPRVTENQPSNQVKIAEMLARFHLAKIPGDHTPVLFRRRRSGYLSYQRLTGETAARALPS